LPDAGFTRLSPAEGAFYLFADIADGSNDRATFCARMLAEVAIAVTPGGDLTMLAAGGFCGSRTAGRNTT
jgi:aspartate/methionine/tyrosine aminotransferase